MGIPSFATRLATAAVLVTAALAAGGSVATASAPAPAATPAEINVSAPEVFGGFADNVPFGNNVLIGKKMFIPIGTYTTTAKVVVSGDGSFAEVKCRITTALKGGDADESRVTLSSSARTQTMSLQFNMFVDDPDAISLSCTRNASATGVVMTWMKIAAIRVADPDHLHNGPLS